MSKVEHLFRNWTHGPKRDPVAYLRRSAEPWPRQDTKTCRLPDPHPKRSATPPNNGTDFVIWLRFEVQTRPLRGFGARLSVPCEFLPSFLPPLRPATTVCTRSVYCPSSDHKLRSGLSSFFNSLI